MKSNKNHWLRHSATHHGSKAKQTELVRTSLRQHSVFNAFFTYGAPLTLPRPILQYVTPYILNILSESSIDWPQKAMGKNSKESLVKLGIELAKSTKSTEEERGDHPAALMIAEVFALSLMET